MFNKNYKRFYYSILPIICIILKCNSSSVSDDNKVRVKVQQGWLAGEILELVTGDGSYCSFKGVPYARPPVGSLRFKAPAPASSWNGTRNAKEHGPMCPQFDIYTDTLIPGNEDCLYLNVYTRDLNPPKPRAVMFFIHGGGFLSGSGNSDDYGPDFLVKNDVILVTINYRVGALGFLCMDTNEVPGNAGLKDQVLALKWVKENIAQFGGDPDNVTIFGQSAGGSAVALHVLSPMSSGLFRRAISMSGVPACEWSMSFESRRRAFKLGELLGYDNTKDPNKLLEFLQSLPTEQIITTNPYILSFEKAFNDIVRMYFFTPVVENNFGKDNFLVEEPSDILMSGKLNYVDFLIGRTNLEAALEIPMFETFLTTRYNRYHDLFVPRKIIYQSLPRHVLEISDRIRQHYFGNKTIGLDLMKPFVNFISESVYNYEINKFIKNFPEDAKNKRYFYTFSGVSERSIYGAFWEKYDIRAAGHLDDLMYLFNVKKLNQTLDKNAKSYKMIEQTCELFTNFAKFGNPTPDTLLGVIWQEYDNKTESYLDIGEKLTPGQHPDTNLDFWDNIYDFAGHKTL